MNRDEVEDVLGLAFIVNGAIGVGSFILFLWSWFFYTVTGWSGTFLPLQISAGMLLTTITIATVIYLIAKLIEYGQK